MGAPKPYYQDEWVTIYHGDCREILPSLEKVDLVLTDPPYGISIVKNGRIGGTSKDLGRWGAQYNTLHNEVYGDDKPIDPLPLLDISKHQIIWGGNYIADRLYPARCWLVWYKRIKQQSNNMADCELAWTSFDKPSKVFQHMWMGMLRDSEMQEHHHPTQKPVALMKWAIQQGDNPQSILDPYMGAGAVILAAKQLNRKCTGIEIKEKYCEITAKRCSQGVFNFSEVVGS